MRNSDSFNATLSCFLTSVPHAVLEVITWCIALFCSVIEILFKCLWLLFRCLVKLAIQLTFVLLLASIFLLAYAAIMGVSMAFGPGINSQLS